MERRNERIEWNDWIYSHFPSTIIDVPIPALHLRISPSLLVNTELIRVHVGGKCVCNLVSTLSRTFRAI